MKIISFLSCFILLFIFSTTSNLSGQSCDYKLNKKDEFTGKDSLLTRSEIVKKSGRFLLIELLRTEGKYYLTMNYAESLMKANGWSCTADDPLIFIFSDGTTLSLQSTGSFITEKVQMNSWAFAFLGNLGHLGDRYIFAPKYHIDKSELKLLYEKTITKFRITAKGYSGETLQKIENIEFDLDTKQATTIKSDTKCIVGNDTLSEQRMVPEQLPVSNETNKVTFEGVIEVPGVGKDVLYDRAKNWLIKFTKSSEFITEDKVNGEIIKKASFTKLFERESNEFIYVLTILFKDNKYKYTITDIVISDGRISMELEKALEAYKKRTALIKDVNQKTFEGIMDAVDNMKKSIESDPTKTKSDW